MENTACTVVRSVIIQTHVPIKVQYLTGLFSTLYAEMVVHVE